MSKDRAEPVLHANDLGWPLCGTKTGLVVVDQKEGGAPTRYWRGVTCKRCLRMKTRKGRS